MIEIEQLVWDEWNVAHIARHTVVPGEVVEACRSDPLVEETHSNRYLVVGRTWAGKLLSVVLAPTTEASTFYVVTARIASRKEQRRYRQIKGGENT